MTSEQHHTNKKSVFSAHVPDRLTCLLWGLIGLGIFLHTAQYWFNRSLWVDEASLALHILENAPIELPPPIGFILIEKAVVGVFGDSEYALRLFPFLSSLLAILVFFRFCARHLSGAAASVSLGLFAISGRLIYHSSDLKQYASDVLITLVILSLAERLLVEKVSRRALSGIGVCGAICVWISHPAIFVLAGIGATLTARQIRKKYWRDLVRCIPVYIGWIGSFSLFYLLLLRSPTQSPMGQEFWNKHFMPFPPFSLEAIGWFVRTFFETIEYVLELPHPLFDLLTQLKMIGASVSGISPSIGLRLPELVDLVDVNFGWLAIYAVAAFLLVAGWITVARRNRWLCLLLSFPLLFTLLASGLHKYPFANRLILFLFPAFFLFWGAGAAGIFRKTKGLLSLFSWALIVILCIYPIVSAGKALLHPRIHEEARSVMRYLGEHRQPGDAIYVYYASPAVYRYYARRFGFENEPVITGIMSREDWNKYLEDLNQLRGKPRVWLFFSHAYQEEAFFIGYLDTIGTRLDERKDVRASVYLYNLAGH